MITATFSQQQKYIIRIHDYIFLVQKLLATFCAQLFLDVTEVPFFSHNLVHRLINNNCDKSFYKTEPRSKYIEQRLLLDHSWHWVSDIIFVQAEINKRTM